MWGEREREREREREIVISIFPQRFPIRVPESVVNPFPNKNLVFTCLKYTSFEDTVEKGEIARNPFGKLSAIFIKFEIFVCKLSV